MISNLNYSASATTDRGIVVEGLTLDAEAITRSKAGFHGVGLRQVSEVVVRAVTCRNIGDCTAFEATTGTLVEDSIAYNVANVGFDHWEGPRDAVVRRSSVYVDRNGVGVMFTGAAGTWTRDRDRHGENLIAQDVHVYGPAAVGVTANVLSAGSSLQNVQFGGCSIDLQSGLDSSGIIITGNVTNGSIIRSVIHGLNGGQAIAVTPDLWHSPEKITISNARIFQPRVSARNVAPVVALGRHHRIADIQIIGGAYNFAIWANDTGISVTGRLAPGMDGEILNRP